MSTHLTQRAVDAIAPTSAPDIFYDSELSGFCLVVETSGGKHWIVWLRLNRERRPVKRLSLGTTSDLTADQARGIARWLLGPRVGSLDFNRVSLAELEQLRQDIAAVNGQAVAKRVLRLLSTVFRPTMQNLRRHQMSKSRHLSLDELGRLGSALASMERPGLGFRFDSIDCETLASCGPLLNVFHAAAFRLMLLSLATEEDVVNLRWEDVDFDAGLISPRPTTTRPRKILLNSPSLNVLRQVPKAGRYIIVGGDPEKPRQNLVRPWHRLTEKAKIQNLSLRSLRNTQLWMCEQIEERLDGAVAIAKGGRSRDADLTQARRATEAVGTAIAAALEGRFQVRRPVFTADAPN